MKIINYIIYGLLIISLVTNGILFKCNSDLKVLNTELSTIETPEDNTYKKDELKTLREQLEELRITNVDERFKSHENTEVRKNFHKSELDEHRKNINLPEYLPADSVTIILSRYGSKSFKE